MAVHVAGGGFIKWKEKALAIQRTYYLSFAGTQWHEFVPQTDKDLVRAKLCFAIFGPPQEDAKDIESAYTEEQKVKAGDILSTILQVHSDAKMPKDQLRLGFIFICCKQEESEFVTPLFTVYAGKDSNGNDMRKVVDLQSRVYKDWEDWRLNNKLSMLKYCYPTRGFYTCSGDNQYKFDEKKDPDVEYGTSPQCDLSARFFRQADVAATATSLVAGTIGIVAMFTPLAPVVLTVTAVSGGVSAVYGAGRGVERLVDKGTHGESMADLESFALYFSLAATPLHFMTSAVNGTLAVGARQGRIFSNNMRLFATILNFSTLSVDGVMLAFGLGNLIQKAKNDDLKPLDVLQFAMSAFFFTNTLIQPKVASSIIAKAQNQHIDQAFNQMTDEGAKQAFKNFLDRNQGEGTITDRSKIIRTINRMNDPNKFFSGVGADAKVDIGGRKGKTVLVTDQHEHQTRVNPNKTMFTSDTRQYPPYNFNRDFNRLKKCYGKDPNDVELNGEKIFANLTDEQKRRVGNAFGGSAKFDQDIVKTAHSIAESMGYRTGDQLMSVIEILAAQVAGKDGIDLTTALTNIRGAERQTFISGINQDLRIANQYSQRAGIKFEDPLLAVYHYRKHGAEFPNIMKKFGSSIDVYLGPVRDNVFNDSNLKQVIQLQDGAIKKIYAGPGDKFGVAISKPNCVKISTMFVKPDSNQQFINDLAAFFRDSSGPAPPAALDAALVLGWYIGNTPPVRIHKDGKSSELKNCPGLDINVEEEISTVLLGLSETL